MVAVQVLDFDQHPKTNYHPSLAGSGKGKLVWAKFLNILSFTRTMASDIKSLKAKQRDERSEGEVLEVGGVTTTRGRFYCCH